MCNQVTKEIFYQEGAIGRRAGVVDRVNYRPNKEDSNDFVSVELRRYEFDVILEARVCVDGEVVIDTREFLDSWMDTSGNVRKAIAKFDELLRNHPMTWRTPEVLEELPF